MYARLWFPMGCPWKMMTFPYMLVKLAPLSEDISRNITVDSVERHLCGNEQEVVDADQQRKLVILAYPVNQRVYWLECSEYAYRIVRIGGSRF